MSFDFIDTSGSNEFSGVRFQGNFSLNSANVVSIKVLLLN